jgi:hypothetical protein
LVAVPCCAQGNSQSAASAELKRNWAGPVDCAIDFRGPVHQLVGDDQHGGNIDVHALAKRAVSIGQHLHGGVAKQPCEGEVDGAAKADLIADDAGEGAAIRAGNGLKRRQGLGTEF